MCKRSNSTWLLSKCSRSSNGTKPKVYFQREQSEPEVFCGNRPRGVTVSTLDSESSDRGSNPREVSRQILKTELKRRMQHCTRQHHRLCFNASLCEKLSFPTHGYRLMRGRSRYQMAHLSESPKHPMRCVRDLTVLSSQNVRASSNGTKPKVYFQREQSEPEVFCGNRPRGVTVSTLDSESSDRGSNPREVSRQILKNELKENETLYSTAPWPRFNASLCEKLSFPTHGYRLW